MAVRRAGVAYQLSLVLALLFGLAAVGGVLFLDEQREFDVALSALLDEQVALATALAADVEGRIASLDDAERQLATSSPAAFVPKLLGGAVELEQADSRVILVLPPGGRAFLSATGKVVQSSALSSAFTRGATSATFARRHGPALGLPERMVVAGLRRIEPPGGEVWDIAVVASAQRLRMRERHAQVRITLGLVIAATLVSGFGALALRDERRKLLIARNAEVDALQRDKEKLLAQADKMATLAALSSGVAHQLATPLGTITARVEQVLIIVRDNPKATAALGVVNEQVQRIQQTIRGLLDIARGNRPSLVTAQASAVARAAQRAVLHRFEPAGVGVDVLAAERLPAISCDPPILEQALVNLLLNALDASERGGRVQLHVEALPGKVSFAVDDDGQGITDEAAAHAGEPFYTTKPQAQGTGLGLSIAREIAESMGGKLSIARRVDARGTRATIELPVSRP